MNYVSLTNRLNHHVSAAHISSRAPTSVPPRSVASSNLPRPHAYIRGTKDSHYPDSEVNARRSSRDIELDYIVDEESSVTLPRYRELDSNVGVNYYYRDRARY